MSWLPSGWVIHWDLWVQFSQAVAWPLAALIGLGTFAGPVGKLINKFTKRIETGAGEITAGPISFKLASEVDAGLKKDSEERGEGYAPSVDNAIAPADFLAATNDGWKLIEESTRDALNRIPDVPPHVKGYVSSNPLLAFNWMVLNEWVGFSLRDSLKALWDIRSGQAGQITDAGAKEFSKLASKAARSLAAAVNYRLNKHASAATMKAVAGSEDTGGEAIH
jgi:hypothetical protein